MQKKYSFSIKNYVIVLIGFFFICSLATNLFYLNTFENIRINGYLYASLKASKDLKADILPPKLYIVESYLLMHQIVNESNTHKIEEIRQKIDKSRKEYFKYYEFWKNNIKDEKISNLLITQSHEYVVEFYNMYEQKFLPMLLNKNVQGLQSVINDGMTTLFDLHRGKIDEASNLIEASNTLVENNAEKTANNSVFILAGIYLVSLTLALIISIFFIKRIKGIENNIILSRRDTELANARLENIITGLRKFKHSYDNTLAAVKGYIVKEDISGLNRYIEEIIADKKENELRNYVYLDMLKNSGLMGLILSKLICAERYNIEFKISIDNEVGELHSKEVGIKISHLLEVLGILLDNAIQSAAESEDKSIDLSISNAQELISFEIQNSTKDMPDMTKMFEKGWTSKGENRGLGLWILKNLISLYDNIILNTFVSEKNVRMELLITKIKIFK